MNRLLLILLSQLAVSTSLIATTNVHAANDLERWNSDVGRTVRQSHSEKLAQTTYTELDSRNVTVSQDMKTVHPQIETRSQVAGSRTRVVAEATLVVDKDKVWRDWNKKLTKFGKGTAAGLAAGAIVQGIVDGVGWVMDPENNTIKKKPTGSQPTPQSKPTHCEYYYSINSRVFGTVYGCSITDLISNIDLAAQSTGNYKTFKSSNNGTNISVNWTCQDNKTSQCGGVSANNSALGNAIFSKNSNYQGELENIEVSEEEKEQVLKDLLNDPKYADLAAQMIGNTYSMGPDNPEPDPNIVNDLKNKQKDVLKSDNPKGDGKTRTDPKIDTGTQGQADTTPKPDTGTGTDPDPGTTPTPNPNPNTGSTTNFELPAFCNYAAIVCDWIGWTKEEPELEEDSELEIEEQELIDYEYSDHIKFDASCPFKPRQEIFPLGALGDMRVEVDFSYFCEIATMMKSFVVALSGFIAVLMLAYAAKDI